VEHLSSVALVNRPGDATVARSRRWLGRPAVAGLVGAWLGWSAGGWGGRRVAGRSL